MMTISESNADVIATLSTETLRRSIDAIDAIADECILDFEGGLTSAVADPANVALGELTLSRGAFHELEGNGRIGANVCDLKNFLSPGVGSRFTDEHYGTDPLGETTTLMVDCDRRRVSLESGAYSYLNSAIDPESVRQEPDLPNMDLPLCVEIDAPVLQAATDYIDGFADRMLVRFDHDPWTLTLSGEGKVDEGAVRLAHNDGDGVTIHEPGDAHSLLSTDYARNITRAIPKDERVMVYAGEEFPVTYQYTFANGTGTVEYMQAPRIASD